MYYSGEKKMELIMETQMEIDDSLALRYIVAEVSSLRERIIKLEQMNNRLKNALKFG